ncbi:MAG TPA: biotin-dependent carboxyltransferase family protein [Burkholderiaceae bacterium]|nr:biotin-dependent carboxyltransferase family protein [Burkholderiaceae bacterium]
MTIEVIKPGALTTLQDLGRRGFQHLGVPVGGVMDERSHRVANLLVGNSEHEATLEITLLGPSLRFQQATLIAIAGADLSACIGEHAVPLEAPVLVRAGSQLNFGRRVFGVRTYLAVHGGFAVPAVMQSKSTYVRGKFGGFQGRALQKGDALELMPADAERVYPRLATKLRASPLPFSSLEDRPRLPGALSEASATALRAIVGQQWQAFSADAQRQFQQAEFRLSPHSDRMGFRLEGPRLALREPLEMISEAVAFGTVQVPPDGNPIVLMADRQTTGGYPKIASVASVDLPVLAQRMAPQSARFALISLEQAQQLYLAYERTMANFAAQVQQLRRS